MVLNHLNLPVTDLPAARAFLVEHFGLTPGPGDRERFAVLEDGQGMLLALSPARTAEYPKLFHVGFMQSSPDAVDRIHERLVAAGIDAPAPSVRHGSWTFYFTAPGGIVIEVQSMLPTREPVAA